MHRGKHSWPVATARALLLLTLLFVGVSVGLVGILRWATPPTSAFMIRHALVEESAPEHRWVGRGDISAWAALAAVAAEDQKFPQHSGFDLEAIVSAVREHRQGERLRGASTISQQVAKNLFLWPGRSFVRKGLEAWFTVLIELLWSKPRILEVYLNIAQFGPDIYGVEAAARRYFGIPAERLTRYQAALLATVLPNPRVLRIDRPSAYVLRRRDWIVGQMQHLGDPGHLPGFADGRTTAATP